jgi:peptide-methionine (S)-S-oxide reductase
MGDHTECFQVDFDPAAVSYEDLLELFWTSHDPTRSAWKTQYASLVLAHDEDQLAAACASAERFSAIVSRPVATRIGMLGHFWLAEDYHQKYYLRSDRVLMADFRAMFGADERAFLDSPAAARVNGFAAGDGSKRLLDGVIDELGLSEAGRSELLRRVR